MPRVVTKHYKKGSRAVPGIGGRGGARRPPIYPRAGPRRRLRLGFLARLLLLQLQPLQPLLPLRLQGLQGLQGLHARVRLRLRLPPQPLSKPSRGAQGRAPRRSPRATRASARALPFVGPIAPTSGRRRAGPGSLPEAQPQARPESPVWNQPPGMQ